MTTEHATFCVSGGASAAAGRKTPADQVSPNIGANDGTPYSVIPKRAIAYGSANSQVSDVIGVDVTPGTRQEEISYMGKNTNLQAEIKKEYVVTLTRKVSDNTFDVLFNTPARDGVYDSAGVADGTTGAVLHDGLRTSKNRNFGYRIHLELGDNALGSSKKEVMTIRNCCITAHSRTLDANNAQEETIEFYSYVQPLITTGTTAALALTAATDI